MSDRLAGLVSGYSKPLILVAVLVVAGLGAGATGVEQSSSLSQFETDSPEGEALEYVESNFTAGDANTTTVQVIVRNDDGNVLSRASLLRSLRFQQRLQENESINATLADDQPVIGVSNVVAIAAIRLENASELRAEARALQERNATLQERREQLRADRADLRERRQAVNATVDRLRDALNRTRELQGQFDQLNASLALGDVSEQQYERNASRIRESLSAVRADAVEGLNASETATFDRAAARVRSLQHDLFELRVARERGEIDQETYDERFAEVRSQFPAAYRLGTRGVLAGRFAALEAEGRALRERGEQLRADGEALRADFEALQERQAELGNATTPALSEQIAQLESMNASAVESTVATVVGEGGGPAENESAGGTGSAGSGPGRGIVFELLPTTYEEGSTTATARTMIVVQQTETDGTVQGPGGPGDAVTDAQLALEDVAASTDGSDDEYIVFGFGIISDEISRSQTDSFLLVGPLALLFVLVALLVAYRDLVDIVLGFVGIFSVLAITFGAMGWLGVAFNQVLIAVPVLLIGLSIDYAIHIFMRHREQRGEDDTPRVAMQSALAGVGVALLWVTATTVIGFASNLISPLGPIRDFGIVSSIGIVGAMFVFGLFVPALKVEIDSLLEGLGVDRRKEAFGTGGGVLSRLLSVGAWAARRAPAVVIVIALVLTLVAGAAGSQVSTSFEQSDFIADDPPEWMDSLPEPFRPGEYSAKQNLEYVNENFRREDAQSQVLVRAEGGGIATAEAMAALDAAEERAGDSEVTFVLSNGEPAVRGPLSEMRALTEENRRFRLLFEDADTDDDGVPEENVEGVLTAFFDVAPDRAADVIHREGGTGGEDARYLAGRIVVSVKGTAGTGEVTAETREMAAAAEDGGEVTAIATGSQVVNQIVQEDLLRTVIESLAISIVAVFLFLMVAYRITEGSASLGAVTLLPVALSVAWIVGTMFALEQPFNVLTGTITSLTVGLGVAYSIHLSERYYLELERRGDVHEAMRTAVTGTGGALLGSAATTVGGFGTLVIAIFPALQQFGLITGLTIVYAFLASVLVLPSLLVVWTNRLGPDVEAIERDPDLPSPAATGAGSSGDTGPGSGTTGARSRSTRGDSGGSTATTAGGARAASGQSSQEGARTDASGNSAGAPGADSADGADGASGGTASASDGHSEGGGTGSSTDDVPRWNEKMDEEWVPGEESDDDGPKSPSSSPRDPSTASGEDDGSGGSGAGGADTSGDADKAGDGSIWEGDGPSGVSDPERSLWSEEDIRTDETNESGGDDGDEDDEDADDEGPALFGGRAEPVPDDDDDDEE